MSRNTPAPEIAVIGGGTGSFTLLSELKKLTPEITAIVNMCDDGGSTGELRDELGVLPPGDVRQCLVALSDNPEVRDIFSFRFPEDTKFGGHSLGNLILSGLELRYGAEKALKVAGRMLNITGSVVPASLDNHTLEMVDGSETIYGEHAIGQRRINHADAVLRLNPGAKINPEAKSAIANADLVVIAPGNIYGSILPIFAIDGMAEAVRSSKATIVQVTNLVTKPGQTDGWHVVDYVKAVENYIGEGQVDVALYNNEPITEELLRKYADDGEFPVDTQEDRLSEIQARAIGARLVSPDISVQNPHDRLRRTLIRHDATKVGRQLMRLYYE